MAGATEVGDTSFRILAGICICVLTWLPSCGMKEERPDTH